jgi:GntR family transcriptional regulator
MLTTGRPRHEQLSDWLRREIDEGRLRADEQLPSESQLGRRFEVSRITVRRALQTLEHEGLIYRRQGLGSFVRSRRARQGLVRLTDFVEDMAQAGLQPSSRVTFWATERACSRVAAALLVPEGTTVTRIDRLRLGDGAPVAFDRTWLPSPYGHLLDGHDLEAETFYRILEGNYQIPVLRGMYNIEAIGAAPDVARHLDVPAGQALLLITRTTLTHGDRRLYYQHRYYRSDRVVYHLELARDPASALQPSAGMPLREFEPVFRSAG